jgi:hypothetical protein
LPESIIAALSPLLSGERPHQALGYATPDHVYRAGVGGGALIVDKFGWSANGHTLN